MRGWLLSKEEKAQDCRQKQMQNRGLPIKLPPIERGGFIFHCLECLGWATGSGFGPSELSPTEIINWRDGTGTPIGGLDFQCIIDVSRAFVSAFHRFDETNDPPPFDAELTPEERDAMIDAQEAMFEKMLGG